MIGWVGEGSLFFIAGHALGQGSAATLVDRVTKIALAIGWAALGRYPIHATSPFFPSGAPVVDNVAGVLGIMGDL